MSLYSNIGAEDIIRLDVGGTLFSTSRSTLTRYGSPFFASLLLNSPTSNGSYFIDRDPKIFALILEALRGAGISAPIRPDSNSTFKSLLAELDFYGLPSSLVRPLENRASSESKDTTAKEERKDEFEKYRGMPGPSYEKIPPGVSWFWWRDQF